MQITITTRYSTTPTGRGKITAKGAGRQATEPWHHDNTATHNHRGAAALLIERLGWLDGDGDADLTLVTYGDSAATFTATQR